MMHHFLAIVSAAMIAAWIVWPLKHEAPEPEDYHGGICIIAKGTSECIELEPLNYSNIVIPS